MKTTQPAVTVAQIEDEFLVWLFGQNATATIKRICAEHDVTPRDLISSIVNEIAAGLEEDLVTGVNSGGENEWGQVRYAKMGGSGGNEWDFLAEEKHTIGSKRFFHEFSDRIDYLTEAMGAMPKQMATAA